MQRPEALEFTLGVFITEICASENNALLRSANNHVTTPDVTGRADAETQVGCSDKSDLSTAFDNLGQWFPTFFDALLPVLILELFILPLLNFHSFPVRVRSLVLTTIGAMFFTDDNNLIN